MEFRILDTDYIDIEILDQFRSMIWTDRYSSWGDFEISLPPTIENLAFLKNDYYIWSSESEHSMIIEDIRIRTDEELGNELIVTGRSLESILDRRIIWNQTNLSGNFQNAIKKLIEDSIIIPTDSRRTISNFIFQNSTDPHILNLTIEAQITGANLYETIKKLCDERNIGFKINLSQDNKFIFSLYSGTDRSYNQTTNPYVIFSPNFDNLINSNYFYSKRHLKTVNLVAGEGEGLDRFRVEVESSVNNGLNRREMYTDARDLSTNNGEISQEVYQEKLIQRGREYLAENIINKGFEGNVDTFHAFIFGRDFFMGDIIQIANEYGIESTSRVIELIYSHNDEGISVYPTFMTIED